MVMTMEQGAVPQPPESDIREAFTIGDASLALGSQQAGRTITEAQREAMTRAADLLAFPEAQTDPASHHDYVLQYGYLAAASRVIPREPQEDPLAHIERVHGTTTTAVTLLRSAAQGVVASDEDYEPVRKFLHGAHDAIMSGFAFKNAHLAANHLIKDAAWEFPDLFPDQL